MVKKTTMRNDLKVIALVGECNTGKSLTMRNVIVKLLNMGARLIKPIKYSRLSNSAIISDIQQGTFTKKGAVSEMTVILEIKGKKVLVTTYGDEWKGLEEKFRNDVYLYVCAAHNIFVKENNGNNLKKVTKKGWLITIGRNFYNSTCPTDLNVAAIQQKNQDEQAQLIVQEIYKKV